MITYEVLSSENYLDIIEKENKKYLVGKIYCEQTCLNKEKVFEVINDRIYPNVLLNEKEMEINV